MATNLQQAIAAYWQANKNVRSANSNLTTALLKYTLPGMGFELNERSKDRMQPEDKDLALKFAEEIELTPELLQTLPSTQKKVVEKYELSNTNKRQQKKNLDKFISFVEHNFKIDDIESKKVYEPIKKPIPYRRKLIDRSHIQEQLSKKVRINKKITLSFNPEDYQGDFANNKKELDRIQLEINKATDFLVNNAAGTKKRREATLEHTSIANLKRLLGWLYLDGKSLSEISIHSLIKVFDINPDRSDFDNINDYYIAKGKIEYDAKKAANKVIEFLNDFYLIYGVITQKNKINYAIALLNLSKYLYRDITDVNWYQNYEDIPVIRRIRIHINSIEKDPKQLEINDISWKLVMQVVEEQRRKADMIYKEYLKLKKGRKSSCIEKVERDKSSIARDLEGFICLGLLTLAPPSRSRVIRELRLGETFKHGLFIDGIFIPKEKIDNPESAKYYIHVQPKDYKTGDTYGEWLGEFPNIKFKDGKTFYEYLDRFIYGWERNYLMKRFDPDTEHSNLLVKIKTGEPINEISFYSLVSNRFKAAIGQKVSPHKLRTIFRTYLVNKNATQQELDSAAFWMRHSNKTAAKTYTKQTLDEKLAAGKAIATKLNSEILLST